MGGHNKATLHEHTAGGQKVPSGEFDAVLIIPLNRCCALVNSVLDQTLHAGKDLDQICLAPPHDRPFGDVYRATLQFSVAVLRCGGLPLVVERKWIMNLVLTLCAPVVIQTRYAEDVVAVL